MLPRSISIQYVPSAPEKSKISHRPDGKNAHALVLILTCTTAANASVIFSMYVPQRTLKTSHRPDGKMADMPKCPDGKNADALALILALHNWERFGQVQSVRAAETFKSSRRPGGKMADMPKSTLIFQFGSLFGSIRDLYVPATPANFPSPRWEDG